MKPVDIQLEEQKVKLSDVIYSEETKLESEQQWDLDLPEEILEHVFRCLEYEHLKTCRLVSSLWNSEICRLLRRNSYVILRERDSERLKGFEDLLRKNSNFGLANPYHLFSLEAETFQDETLSKILALGRLHPFKLIMHQPPIAGKSAEQEGNVWTKFFDTQSNHIRTMCFVLEDEEEPVPQEDAKALDISLFFPELTKVRMIGSWNSDSSNQFPDPLEVLWEHFICRVINFAPRLKTFESNFCNERILHDILCHANLTNIQNLLVFHLTPHLFRKLKSLYIPRLLTFHAIIDPNLLEEEFVATQTIHQVVDNFSASIEELFISWNFNSIHDDFPKCPRLRTLSIKYWSGSLAAFNERTLPALKRVHVYDCVNEPGLRVLNPHPGVHTFAFECLKGTGVRFGLYSEEDFSDILLYAQRQFPQLTSLDLNLALTTKSLRMIVSNFPQLEKLLLDSDNEYKESIFTGIGEKQLKYLIGTEANLEACNRAPSFLHLKGLKQLVLSRQYEYRFPYDVSLTDNGIVYGLSKLPKLELLQFDWEEDLSLEVVLTYLKDVPKIVINYVDDVPNLGTLLSLKKVKPHQFVLCRHSSNLEEVCSRLRRSSTRRPRHRHRLLDVD